MNLRKFLRNRAAAARLSPA